jgi:hypothetical protein
MNTIDYLTSNNNVHTYNNFALFQIEVFLLRFEEFHHLLSTTTFVYILSLYSVL